MNLVKKTFYKKKLNSWLIMFTCGVFYGYQFMLRVLPNTLSQEFMDAFKVDAAGFGFIIAFYSAAYAGLQIPLGITIDRIKIKYLLPIAPMICAMGALGMVHSDSIFQASLARFTMGVGSAFGFIGTVKVATIILSPNRVSVGIGMTILFGTLGAMMGGRPLKALTTLYAWQDVVLYLAVVGVVLSAILFLALSSVLIEIKQDQALAAKRPVWQDLKNIIKNPQIILLSVYGMLTYLPITVLGVGWGIGFLTVFFGIDYSTAANAVAILFMGAGIGSPLVAAVSEMINSRKIMMLLSSLAASCLYASMLYADWAIAAWQLYVLLFIAGVLYSAKTLSFVLACDLASKETSGLTTSVLNMTVMAAGLIFHPLIGYLLNKGHEAADQYTKYDYQVALSVLPISAIIALVLVLLIKDYHKDETQSAEDRFISMDD